ncbi:MAG: hypothetical protein R3A52_26990 [Polyangiales bacterium]
MSRPVVALVVTGQVEHKALHRGLQRAFPDADFVQQTLSAPLDGFTTARLDDDEPVLEWTSKRGAVIESSLAKLVDQLILAVYPGRHQRPADFAVLVDDVELCNADRVERVVEHVRRAVPRRLTTQAERGNWSSATASKVERAARTQCSFHLMSPMVEALFFAEPEALDRAGRALPSRFDAARQDCERFTVDDPDYVSAPVVAGATDWRKRPPADRALHPKAYLQYLATPVGEERTRYQETRGGVAALSTLGWEQVVAVPDYARFARAMLADIADMTGARPGWLEGGALAPETDAARGATVLRNV